MKLAHMQVYRGYRWYLSPDEQHCEQVECAPGYFILGGGLDLRILLVNGAYAVHSWRRRELTSDFPPSFDGIPWEIHEIINEIAYQAALAAYKEVQL